MHALSIYKLVPHDVKQSTCNIYGDIQNNETDTCGISEWEMALSALDRVNLYPASCMTFCQIGAKMTNNLHLLTSIFLMFDFRVNYQ